MMRTTIALALLLCTRLALSSVCEVRENPLALYEQKDKNLHVFFTRCHPTLPLAFTNQSIPPKDGKDEYLQPIMLDMKTGAITEFKTPEGHSAEDIVPSPDGKLLYVDLTEDATNKSKLGIYEIQEGKIVERSIIEIKDGAHYGYPSPAIRDGKQMIMGRRYSKRDQKTKPHLDIVDEKTKTLVPGPELCPAFDIETLNYDSDRPYISPDGEFLATAINNAVTILKIRWDKMSPDKTQIPCEVVTKLPESASKVSFSADNKKIVFHASQKDYLGRDLGEHYDPQSFMMDLTTGETIQLTKTEKGKVSQFPYFCGEKGIIVREVYGSDSDSYNAKFKLLPIPETKSEMCEKENSLIKFWEALCLELTPSKFKPSFSVKATKGNCDLLLKEWRKKKKKSKFTEKEIRAACGS